MDQREAREVGEKAVQFVSMGQLRWFSDHKRVGNYAVDYVLEDVRDIGGKTRLMPMNLLIVLATMLLMSFTLM